MLKRLSIKNYALIDTLDISFAKTLNIITGETGAGKSIILGALSLLLGQRAEGKYFFNQQKKCVIEGDFLIGGFHLEQFFAEYDLDYAEETVLRREISSDGKSRSFINDTPVNLATLKKLGERLIDVHSQHATLEINNEDFQLLVVDTVAGNTDLLNNYQKTFKAFKAAGAKLDDLVLKNEQLKTEQDFSQFQFNELQSAGLIIGEQEELEEESKLLTHAEEIKRSLNQTLGILRESDFAVLVQLKDAVLSLGQAARYQSEIHELQTRLDSSLIEIKDIVSEVERIEQSSFIDENRIEVINSRLDLIYSLQKKHRVTTVSELINIQDSLSSKLNEQLYLEQDIEKLEAERQLLKVALINYSEQLRERRKEIVPHIQEQVRTTLSEVGMINGRLEITVDALAEEVFTGSGSDQVRFLFSANKGQSPLPMNKVASGGELSRLMLSIKSLIAKHTSLPTIIFDEIDTGISGEVALRVGSIMEKLAESMQVIAITHLPQIASKGEAHYNVYKEESADLTKTGIRVLNSDERVFELAKMLSGNKPGESALQNARELLT